MATQEITLKLSMDAAQATAALNELASSTKASVSQVQASVVAGQQVFSRSLKSLETQMASLKARIKEVKAETDVGFKTQRLDALNNQLRQVTTQHRDLTKATKDSALAMKQDLSGALSTVSPQLGALAGAAGPITLIAVGLVAATAATALLAKGIFDLAKSASDYGSKIFDAAQKTNFTVETLSGLDIILRTSGGSLESLIPSLGIFQTNMVKAQEAGSAMSKTFKELNIDTTNQEKAFRQAIAALAALGETETQTAKAKELFGRASKDVLGIIKATPAGLDAELKKLEEMGLLLTGPAAAAADAFGDQLEILNIQFAALGRTIGFEVIPVLTIFMQDLSRALTGSAESWRGWAEVVKTSVAGALAIVEGFVIWVKTHGHVTLGVAIDASFHGLLDRAEQLTGVQTAIAAAQQASRT